METKYNNIPAQNLKTGIWKL